MAIVPTVDQVSRPQAHGYDGSIENILIRLAVTGESILENVTAEASPPKVDTSETGEDVREEVGERYSRSNLSGGAGLDFLHAPGRPDDASLRFWDSKGVDVFNTDKGGIYDARLMHSVEELVAGASIVDMAQIGGTVYYVTGTTLYEYNPSGSDTSRATLSATGKQLIAMGNSLYTLDATDGVERWERSGWTSTNVSPTNFDRMWAVKGAIYGAEDEVLSEAKATDRAMVTLAPGEEHTDLIDAGPVVLAFNTSGYVHSCALDTSLELNEVGRTKFVDEIPILAAESFGVVGVVTAETTDAGGKVARFYVGGIESDVLADLQLIYQVGDRESTDDHTPTAMTATRDSIYTAIPEAGGDEVTLWRYFTPTGGYAGAHSVDPGTSGSVGTFFEIDDRMWVTVLTEGIHCETDEYVISGYVVGPLADFFTADPKQWVSGELSGVELAAGTKLELYDTNDPDLINDPASTDWRLVTQLKLGSDRSTIDTLVGRNARYHAGMVVLRSDSTRVLGPGFRSYSFKAMPNPNRDRLFRIPINISDQIESPGKRAITVPGRGKAAEEALRAFEGSQVLLDLWRPAIQVRGLLERYEQPIATIPKRGSVGYIMYARIRGRQVSAAEGYGELTTGSNLGIGTLGLVQLGTRKEYT